MPDWLNWLAAVTGIVGFPFSIWVYFRESRTRRSLEDAKGLFEKQQAELKAAQIDLDRRVGGMRGLEELAKQAEVRVAGGRK
ncbi:MAG: hypothetical protein ACLPX9_22420 [Rhodomicrobium sp.]